MNDEATKPIPYVSLSEEQQALVDRLVDAVSHKDTGAISDVIKDLKGDEKRIIINAQSAEGDTALSWACNCKLPGIVEFLIENGADVNAKDADGRTALHLAFATDSDGLEPEKLNKVPILVNLLIENGADVNARDEGGRTPLHWIFCAGDQPEGPLINIPSSLPVVKKTVDLLIEKGADVNARDEGGRTALHYACLEDSEVMARVLIDKGNANIEFDDTLAAKIYERRFYDLSIMVDEVLRHVLLPATLLEYKPEGIGVTDEPIWDIYEPLSSFHELGPRLFSVLCPNPDMKTIPKTLDRDDLRECFLRELMRPSRLSRSWSHPGVRISRNLTPLLTERTWEGILKKTFNYKNLKIVCLTSTQDLIHEGRILNHCVGNSDYDRRCCANFPLQRSHILSICYDDGVPLSTAEISWDGGQIAVLQHVGEKNGTPPPQALQAWAAFEHAVAQNPDQWLKPNDELGEIIMPEQEKDDIPQLWREIGFEPSWANINQIYDEYRMPYRRASLPHDGRRLQYEPTAWDGHNVGDHFIQGYVLLDKDDKMVLDRDGKPQFKMNLSPGDTGYYQSIREFDVKSWLLATGLMDEIHALLDDKLGHDNARAERLAQSKSEPLVRREMAKPRHILEAQEAAIIARIRDQERGEARGAYMARAGLPPDLTANMKGGPKPTEGT